MTARSALLAGVFFLALLRPCLATIPPRAGHINDHVGLLQTDERAVIEDRLADFQRTSGIDVAVLVLPALPPDAARDTFSHTVFDAWHIGASGHERGVLLLVAIRDRLIVTQQNTAAPPNAMQAIVRETVIPAFQAGHPSAGLTQGIDRMLALLAKTGRPPTAASDSLWLAWVLPAVIAILIALSLRFRRKRPDALPVAACGSTELAEVLRQVAMPDADRETFAHRPTARELLLVAAVAVACVAGIAALTNALPIDGYQWDFAHYIAMAQEGSFAGHTPAPFAYRFGATLPVHLLHAGLGVPIVTGFRVVAWVGAWATLFLLYLFVRASGFGHDAGLFVLFVAAFSHHHLKYLMFDVYRPDHLAYPLMLLSVWALLRGRWGLSLAIAALGLQVREFLVIPILLLLGVTLAAAWRSAPTRGRLLGRAAVVAVVGGLAVALPRWLIPIMGTYQNIDPLHDFTTLARLLADPLNPWKDLNFVLSLLTYLLPLLLLATPRRVAHVWRMLGVLRPFWIAYTASVLVMALYGGTDYDRFMTYLLLPQAVCLGYMLDDRPGRAELAVVLLAVVLTNRVFLPIPIWDFERYLDYFGGWGDRVNLATLQKFLLLAVAIVGVAVVRMLSNIADTRAMNATVGSDERK